MFLRLHGFSLPPCNNYLLHTLILQRKLRCRNNEESCSYRFLEFIKVLITFFFFFLVKSSLQGSSNRHNWITVIFNRDFIMLARRLFFRCRARFSQYTSRKEVHSQENNPASVANLLFSIKYLCQISDWSETRILKARECIPFWGKYNRENLFLLDIEPIANSIWLIAWQGFISDSL